MTTRMTYDKIVVIVKNKYHCNCGHKFYRKLTDWFTMNPLNKKTKEECRAEIKESLSNRAKYCPKCKESVLPITG